MLLTHATHNLLSIVYYLTTLQNIFGSFYESVSKMWSMHTGWGFLKTTDQTTTYHLSTDQPTTYHQPPTTDQPTTDQVHRPPTNRPSTNKKYEDQKFHSKF